MKTEELRKLFDKNASMLYDHSIDEYVLDFDTFQRLVEEISKLPDPPRPVEDGKQPEQSNTARSILFNKLQGITDWEQYMPVGLIIEAMQEFSSLREVKMPDREKAVNYSKGFKWTLSETAFFMYGFDHYESELKRLNNMK